MEPNSPEVRIAAINMAIYNKERIIEEQMNEIRKLRILLAQEHVKQEFSPGTKVTCVGEGLGFFTVGKEYIVVSDVDNICVVVDDSLVCRHMFKIFVNFNFRVVG